MSASRIDASPRGGLRAADERRRPAGRLAEGELGGRGDLVGHGPDRRAHDPAVGVGLTAQVVERADPGHADRDVDDPPAPRPTERVRHDDRQVDRRAVSRTAARIRPADASGSTGSRVTIEPVAGPTLLASIPPLAQTNPWAVSVMITPFAIRTTRRASRRTTSTWRGSRSQLLGERDCLWSRLDRRSGRRSRPRPSTRSSG